MAVVTAAERLGKRLLELRKASGLSLRDLAARLGLKHHGDFSLFESGRRVLPAKHVPALARIYGVDADELKALQRAATDEVRAARAARAAGLKVEVGGPLANVDARDRTPLLSGRTDLLRAIREFFSAGMPSGATCALVGMPGVGKSQLALHYAHQHAADYDLVWRLQASEAATIPLQLVRLAPFLAIESDGLDPSGTAQAVIDGLSRRGRWLLILDDARNADDVRWLCGTDRGGHVLITSRLATWRSVGREFEVEPLSVEDSGKFLLERTGNRGDPTGIAHALGGLPLALEQAGSLIETLGLTFSDYLSFASEQSVQALDRGNPAYARAGVRQTLQAAIAEAIAADAAAELPLVTASLLGDAPIPIELLADETEVGSGIATLARRNLLKVIEDQVQIHELVQLAMRSRLVANQALSALAPLTNQLLELLPTDIESGADMEQFAALLPHVLAVADQSPASSTIGIALSRCGAALDALGQVELAERLLRRAIAMFRSTGRDDLLADAVHNLAGVADQTNRPAEAILLLEESLTLRQQINPRDEVKIAATKGMLGQALYETDPTRGEALLREALDELTAIVGPEHPFVIVTLGNLSVSIETRGDHHEATRLRLDALTRAENALDEEHPVTAGALVNLALSADPSLNTQDRRRWCERALAARTALMIDDDTQQELRELFEELEASVG